MTAQSRCNPHRTTRHPELDSGSPPARADAETSSLPSHKFKKSPVVVLLQAQQREFCEYPFSVFQTRARVASAPGGGSVRMVPPSPQPSPSGGEGAREWRFVGRVMEAANEFTTPKPWARDPDSNS